ncbi:MAG: helix-turn-helix transcriptional regulator [Acidimicrobiales bacterium]
MSSLTYGGSRSALADLETAARAQRRGGGKRDVGSAASSVESPWLTAPEIAAHLGVSLRTISTWTAEGQIPCVRLPGRIVRFDREAVDAWARGLATHSGTGARRGPRRR